MTETLSRQIPAAQERAKERDPYFDNVKFLTIVLVVVGHTWAQLRGYTAEHAAYMVVYGFHMPLFVFVAGYFSRGFARDAGKFGSMIATVVAPYVVFSLLYRAELYFVKGVHFNAGDWLAPHYLTWFLVALLCWRLTAPIWSHLRWPVTSAVAVAVLVSGWYLTADSTVSRTVSLLPFFVLGLTLAPERFERLRGRLHWWLGAPVLLAAFAAFYLWSAGDFAKSLVPRLLYWNEGYEDMNLALPVGVAGRLAAYALAVVLGLAFLAVVPRTRTWFTELGTRTMYVFLLHGLVIKLFDYTGLLDEPAVQSLAGQILCTLASIALAVVLATRPVTRATRWAVEPPVRWLIRTPAR
ncbi:acyltransferase [Actinomadura craniellae]|uniref:Acyltransferase n=1 Tax=Actinomadura craniellae TaxID=2231787 RepID=A0A365H5C2_9ACTN|nr:acyltransferase family protein [Actinomadura craniellae]RAY14228.1 acyltransferase [Actinomadura craniellae]